MATNTATASTETVTVVVQVEPAPPNEERLQDLLQLFGLILAAVIVVWFSKQVLNLFSVNPDHD
ncbi:hypothetical protein [Comamonas thiooxydans]|uniref:hypothetical protein n=1 Tax=Comamonas thiooxydans TaxID=363952 RepID=UPI00209C2E56|nr:hypothetical protein [Comamonas thiooxydans]MCO8251803.1 hypothetical protein [Comamonas thiooxydans]